MTILPGSRTQEVKSNLQWQLMAAEKIQRSVPGVRFAIAMFKESQREVVCQTLDESSVYAQVCVGRTPELISAATCCLAVSGSVSLELLYHQKPTAIVYHISRLGFFVQKFFRRVRYITLVNLLTAPELFPEKVGVYNPANPEDAHVLMPEYLTSGDPTDALAKHLVGWLTNKRARAELKAKLAALAEEVGQGGASLRAAEFLLEVLESPAAMSDAA